MEQQLPTYPEPIYSPESRIVGEYFEIGISEFDRQGNRVDPRWVKIRMNPVEQVFSPELARKVAEGLQYYADKAEGKASNMDRPFHRIEGV